MNKLMKKRLDSKLCKDCGLRPLKTKHRCVECALENSLKGEEKL